MSIREVDSSLTDEGLVSLAVERASVGCFLVEVW